MVDRLSADCSRPLSYKTMVEGCGFDPLPVGNALQASCQSHWLSPSTEPLRGIEPQSARYQRDALPLSYNGEMADRNRIERLARRPLGFSKPFEEPTSVRSKWRAVISIELLGLSAYHGFQDRLGSQPRHRPRCKLLPAVRFELTLYAF